MAAIEDCIQEKLKELCLFTGTKGNCGDLIPAIVVQNYTGIDSRTNYSHCQTWKQDSRDAAVLHYPCFQIGLQYLGDRWCIGPKNMRAHNSLRKCGGCSWECVLYLLHWYVMRLFLERQYPSILLPVSSHMDLCVSWNLYLIWYIHALKSVFRV